MNLSRLRAVLIPLLAILTIGLYALYALPKSDLDNAVGDDAILRALEFKMWILFLSISLILSFVTIGFLLAISFRKKVASVA